MFYNFNTQPYIVINGRDSRTIKGLLVSKLPPISKPAQRVNTEEIDGRDGDIVTVLGYSAYDKEIDIGLSFEYDIDDIISFFNSSGRIVFSNEPDKYYNFAVYNQIDFDKLIRFKKATVTVHVQPFKFSDSENEKTFGEFGEYNSITIRNSGNYYARPTIAITGAGAVDMYINGEKILDIDFDNTGETIVIDSIDMNARNEDGDLANRQISGNYDNIRLRVGSNIISFVGLVSEVKIRLFSRWI